MASWETFDFAFTCPASVTAEDLRTAYEKVYVEMRKEARGFELSSADIMLGATMLNWFIKHLFTSRITYGKDAGYQHPSQEKDAITTFHTLARDYGDILRKTRPRGTVLTPEQVRDVLLAVLAEVADEDLRVHLQDKFADALESV